MNYRMSGYDADKKSISQYRRNTNQFENSCVAEVLPPTKLGLTPLSTQCLIIDT